MAGGKVVTVHTRSIGEPGRSLNRARMHSFVLDSSSGPDEGLTNTESFLAGISSCCVTLIEKHAVQHHVPVEQVDVAISGASADSVPARFASIAVRIAIRGVPQAEAERLVEVWRER